MSQKRKNKKEKFDFDNDPSYQKLVVDLKKIIEDAKAKGVDFDKRYDTLTCKDCGAREEFSPDNYTMWVYDKDEQCISTEAFIIIDRKEKSYHRKKIQYFKIYYTFICPICGSHQTEVVRERFED